MAHSSAIPAGLFKRFHRKVPYLLTLQEGDPPEVIEKLMRVVFPLFAAGFRSVDALQTISTFLMKWGRRMGVRAYGEVIPNGVATKLFTHTYTAEEIALTKASLGKKEGDVFLVTTSRLVHKNGIDTIIRALPLLPPYFSCIVYGIGPDEVTVRALSEELGVAHRVHFRGQIEHKDIPRVFSACDIFIRPSRSEGMGNSFVEAMAAGLPVIATQEGGLSDFIFDEKRNPGKESTAFVVGKEAPQEIADAVQEILAHPKETKATLARAKALALSGYDWESIASRMKRLFDRVYSR